MSNVPHNADTEKMIGVILNLLVAMNINDEIQITNATFTKMSSDIVRVRGELNKKVVVNTLSNKRIMRIPL